MKPTLFTNVLLVLILLVLLANLLSRAPIRQAEAETFRLDYCITTKADEDPQAYLHVIPHQ